MNPFFHYTNGELWIESTLARDIAAQVGTPAYVYSKNAIIHTYEHFIQAFAQQPHSVCYAVKANSNLAILALLANLGAHFDIVSQGELERLLHLNINPAHIVFSGVGKSKPELTRALQVGIGCFQVESAAELQQLQAIASDLNKLAPIALRVNPNIDVNTHPYIATGLGEHKFGIAEQDAITLYQQARSLSHIRPIGLSCHIGSQIMELEPFLAAQQKMLTLWDELQSQGFALQYLNLGGGLGINYQDQTPISPATWVNALCQGVGDRKLTLKIEPGRSLVGTAGVLLTRVEYLKKNADKHFAIVDAGMNDLIRPALYHAWHNIVPVLEKPALTAQMFDVVGPVCETGDFLGRNRLLRVETGDLLAVLNAGAYGASMSSHYNSRPLACEVMVSGDNIHIIRKRQSFYDLFACEHSLC